MVIFHCCVSSPEGSRSTLILLDWEKAFDRVAQEKVIETLKRLLVPNRMVATWSQVFTKILSSRSKLVQTIQIGHPSEQGFGRAAR